MDPEADRTSEEYITAARAAIDEAPEEERDAILKARIAQLYRHVNICRTAGDEAGMQSSERLLHAFLEVAAERW